MWWSRGGEEEGEEGVEEVEGEVVVGECHFFLPSSSRKDYDVVW